MREAKRHKCTLSIPLDHCHIDQLFAQDHNFHVENPIRQGSFEFRTTLARMKYYTVVIPM